MAVAPEHHPSSAERILAAAADLFAQHGFDGVSTRQIAAATDLNIATIHHHVGTKRDLYLAVVERFCDSDEALVDGIVEAIDDSVIADRDRFRAALYLLIDQILAHAEAHPLRHRFAVRRWLDESDELDQRESAMSLKLFRRLETVLERGKKLGSVRADLNVGYFLRGADWMIVGYFTAGAFSWKTFRADATSRSNRKQFRTFLFDYMHTMVEAH